MLKLKKKLLFIYCLLPPILVILLLKPDIFIKIKEKCGISNTNVNQHYQTMLQLHRAMDASVPNKSVIFLGDSIVQGLATAAVAPYTVNYGIGWATSDQLIASLPFYKSLHRASAIVLAIGINDFLHNQQLGLDDRLQSIISLLPPKTHLVWSSIMPTQMKYVNLANLLTINLTIKTLCEQRGNCTFVDSWRFLTDNDGKIRSELYLNDGIHLNPEGYKLWIDALKKALKQPNCLDTNQ